MKSRTGCRIINIMLVATVLYWIVILAPGPALASGLEQAAPPGSPDQPAAATQSPSNPVPVQLSSGFYSPFWVSPAPQVTFLHPGIQIPVYASQPIPGSFPLLPPSAAPQIHLTQLASASIPYPVLRPIEARLVYNNPYLFSSPGSLQPAPEYGPAGLNLSFPGDSAAWQPTMREFITGLGRAALQDLVEHVFTESYFSFSYTSSQFYALSNTGAAYFMSVESTRVTSWQDRTPGLRAAGRVGYLLDYAGPVAFQAGRVSAGGPWFTQQDAVNYAIPTVAIGLNQWAKNVWGPTTGFKPGLFAETGVNMFDRATAGGPAFAWQDDVPALAQDGLEALGYGIGFGYTKSRLAGVFVQNIFGAVGRATEAAAYQIGYLTSPARQELIASYSAFKASGQAYGYDVGPLEKYLDQGVQPRYSPPPAFQAVSAAANFTSTTAAFSLPVDGVYFNQPVEIHPLQSSSTLNLIPNMPAVPQFPLSTTTVTRFYSAPVNHHLYSYKITH